MASKMRIGWCFVFAVALLGTATFMTTLSMPGDLRAGNKMTNIIITGTLTDKGVECPGMMGDDGQLYSLIGNIEDFKFGQHIRVEGKVVAISHCRRGISVDVKTVELTKE